MKIALAEHLSTEVMRAVQEGATDRGICNAGLPGLGAEPQARPYHGGLHASSSIYLTVREAAAAAGRNIRLRLRPPAWTPCAG